MDALRNRFNELPFHSKMYYKSYHDQMTTEEIMNTFIIGQNGELDPTGLRQDCLGMTPLHILACSTVPCLELFQLMVEKYPENLIVKDSWGATPLLYAVLGNAPSQIVHFLVQSYQFLYPDHEFSWSDMLITLGRANSPRAVIQNLLNVRQMLSPGYIIDWDSILVRVVAIDNRILGKFVLTGGAREPVHIVYPKTFNFLIRYSIATRVNAIGVKLFRDAMADDWMGDAYNFNAQMWHTETLTKLEYYESECRKLKEMASLLELALWKARIDDSNFDQGKTTGRGNKKMKMDPSEFRLKCRISCGADHVIENVLPCILPPYYVRSYVDASDDEDEDDDENDDDDNDYGGEDEEYDYDYNGEWG